MRNDPQPFRHWDDLGRRVPMAIIATDTSGIIRVWSPGAALLYGWSTDEVLGTPIQDVTVGPVQRELADEIMNQVVQGHPWEGNFHARNKNGDVVKVHVVDIPIHDESGTTTGVVGLSFLVDDDARGDSPTMTIGELTHEISVARRRDRSHIAHVLHDDVAQVLGAARSRLLDSLDESNGSTDAARQALVHLDEALAMVRKEVDSLLDVDIDVWEFLLRIREYANDMQRRTGTVVEHAIVGSINEFLAVSDKVALVAHATVREALRNCERHANANHVTVTIAANPRILSVEVFDDGQGMPPGSNGIGTRIMRDSVERLGGTVHITATTTGNRTGTTVKACLPIGG